MSDDQLQESLPPSDMANVPTLENHSKKPKPYFRTFTIIFAILAITLTVFRGMPFLTKDRFALLYYPDTTVLWIVEQSMYLHEATAEFSFIKSLPFVVFAFHRDELIQESEKAIRDVITFLETDHLRTFGKIQTLRANLIVILCETGRFSEARSEMKRLGGGEDVRDFKRAVETIYFKEIPFREITVEESIQIFETGWASSRLKARIERLYQHQADASWTESWIQQQAGNWMSKFLAQFFVTVGLLVAGVYFFATVLIPKWKTGLAQREDNTPPWSAEEGYGIIARSVSCGTLLYFIIPMLGENLKLLRTWSALVLWGPTVLWFYWRISKPGGKKFADYFGLSLAQPQWGLLVGVGIALFAADYVGAIVIGEGLSFVGIESHWIEGINEYLMYETWPWRMADAIEAVIWAPVFEEILFRGLLFAALRKQMNWPWAALISGLCFGAVHFYTIPGFLTVTFFGFILAFSYQKTRSLIPCIIAHALINLMHVWASIWSTSSS